MLCEILYALSNSHVFVLALELCNPLSTFWIQDYSLHLYLLVAFSHCSAAAEELKGETVYSTRECIIY